MIIITNDNNYDIDKYHNINDNNNKKIDTY